MFHDAYRNRRVLLTGHTGFKGTWLSLWLERLGADVLGLALPPQESPSHFALLKPRVRSLFIDVRDASAVSSAVKEFQPEIMFHLAAQPLVRLSYRIPAETFATNVMGSVNVFEAARSTPSVRAIVAVTSDKCYETAESAPEGGFRESDRMGGSDPYSASKGCVELAASAYRRSFFSPEAYGRNHSTLLATARAGNAVGGGDWREDRLIPDLMKAAASGRAASIRNPHSTRPWQHVLEPLGGYLLLGEMLLQGRAECADAWNFGPGIEEETSVLEAARAIEKEWPRVRFSVDAEPDAPYEASHLRLDGSKTRRLLAWRGAWTTEEAFRRTAEWYRDFYERGELDTERQLDAYCADAAAEGLAWTN